METANFYPGFQDQGYSNIRQVGTRSCLYVNEILRANDGMRIEAGASGIAALASATTELKVCLAY